MCRFPEVEGKSGVYPSLTGFVFPKFGQDFSYENVFSLIFTGMVRSEQLQW